MIKETIEKNAEVKVNSKEVEILQKHFPSCFDRDGKFDIKVFEELIKTEDVDIKKEGYSLDFLGKSYARYLASLDSETVIVPDEGNKDINSENIYIVGDNLDALQHLKYSYSERIKCIYIDPPYNTGSDGFVYNDKFEFTAEELAKKIGIEQEEAERVLKMQGTSTHSAWLTFMYPRLDLAKDLLADDGVIFISIDDNEQANLKLLCDLIFGESNFVVQYIWEKHKAPRNDNKYVTENHEYVLCIAKRKESFVINKDERDEKNINSFSNEDDDERGPWISGPLLAPTFSVNTVFPIINPHGKEIYPPKGKCWSFNREGIDRLLKDNRIWFGKEGNNVPRIKRFLSELPEGIVPRSILFHDIYGGNQKAANSLKKLFDDKKIFDYSKPVELIKYFIEKASNKNDIILDFFSGSATTAHAVMQQNLSQDELNRQYIMVQLDEPVKKGSEAEKAGYKTIDEIGRERIRRAAKKIAEENPEKAESLDLGFKTYYLKAADKHTLDKIIDFDPNMPLDAEDIKTKFGKETIIETWKIKDGYGFNAKVEEIDLNGYTAYLLTDSKVGTSLYLIDEMPDNAIVELVRKIEAYELNADRIIEYGYAFSHSTNTALRSNLKTLKNRNAIDPIIRY